MIRILSLVLSIALLVGGTILILGYRADPAYKHSITFNIQYSPQITWQELLNINEIPRRKRDVESIEILEQFGKLTAWKENLTNGGYRIYRMNKREENKQLVIELTSSSYQLTGVWTFDIVPSGIDSQITISEESTLTDIKRRGYRVLMGREYDLLAWQKYIRVGLIEGLLIKS